MSEERRAHIEEAFRLLAGKAYRIGMDGTQIEVEHFCSLAADLERIDCAIGAPGSTPFAQMAETIRAVFTELIAARECAP
jgi:hypothetical protein